MPSSTSYTVTISASGYSSVQTYNSSSITSWRVFSNDGTNVEIISTESVGNLWLKGSIGYVNAVQTLNDLSSAYVNSAYAVNGRSLGYSESGLTSCRITSYKVINTNTYPLDFNASGFPYEDSQYLHDKTVLSNNSLYHSNGLVWLASRYLFLEGDDGGIGFHVRTIVDKGADYTIGLYCVLPGDEEKVSNLRGVRPVITLKFTIKITGGSGTSSNPYTISY